jgi:membrane-associated phospholipid phosphatase
MNFWHSITALGDTGLAVIAGLVIAIWLVAGHRARLAGIWIAVLCLAVLCVATTKLLFMGWGIGIESLDFTGISGHTTLAACVLPVLVRLMAGALRPGYTGSCFFAGEALAGLVGLSRLAIHVHSVSEVVTGFVLGCALSHVFLAVLRNHRGMTLSPSLLGLAMVALMPLMLWESTPSHAFLEQIAMSLSGRGEVYTRAFLVEKAAAVQAETRGGI